MYGDNGNLSTSRTHVRQSNSDGERTGFEPFQLLSIYFFAPRTVYFGRDFVRVMRFASVRV